MIWFLVFTIVSLLVILGVVIWIDEQSHKTPHIPETDIERKVKDIKVRIAQAEWERKRRSGTVG